MNNFIAYALTTIYGFIFSRVLWSFLVIINATYESEFKNYAMYSSAGGLVPFQPITNYTHRGASILERVQSRCKELSSESVGMYPYFTKYTVIY